MKTRLDAQILLSYFKIRLCYIFTSFMHRCSYCTASPPFLPTLDERKLYYIMLNILGILK